MWGAYPMHVKRANTTQTPRFAGPCTIVGNKTSCITSTLRRGSYFSYPGFTDMAVGRYEQCTRGTARCVNSSFERCVGGFWVSTEQCKRSEVCTSNGCRISRESIYPYASTARYPYGTSRYPYYTAIKPIDIGRTIGAAN
jgi:hypothetical protein